MMTTPDFMALVIKLRATQSTTIEQHMGRAVQQFMLDVVQQYSPALSAQLHDDPNEVKPYTASGLHRLEGAPLLGEVRPRGLAWIRIGGLTTEVVHALQAYIAQHPSHLNLNYTTWEITALMTKPEDHEWAGTARYMDMVRHYQTASPPVNLAFEFAAATAFHSKGLNLPVPLPAQVFSSLYRRWQALTPIPLPEQLPTFVEQYVPISRFQGRTDILTFKQGSRQIGFKGTAQYTILQRNAKIERHTDQTDQEDEEVVAPLAPVADAQAFSAALHLLGGFAFYSGVGVKTTTGMGMVRMI